MFVATMIRFRVTPELGRIVKVIGPLRKWKGDDEELQKPKPEELFNLSPSPSDQFRFDLLNDRSGEQAERDLRLLAHNMIKKTEQARLSNVIDLIDTVLIQSVTGTLSISLLNDGFVCSRDGLSICLQERNYCFPLSTLKEMRVDFSGVLQVRHRLFARNIDNGFSLSIAFGTGVILRGYANGGSLDEEDVQEFAWHFSQINQDGVLPHSHGRSFTLISLTFPLSNFENLFGMLGVDLNSRNEIFGLYYGEEDDDDDEYDGVYY
jgi:hypothetical protein